MARARSKIAGIDEHARTIARAVAKGRLPQLTPEIERFLEERRTDLLAASDGACRHIPPAGDNEALGIAYLFLLQILLERARYRAEQGFTEAAEQIATFQAALVTRAEAGEIDGAMLAYLSGALQQARITASPELTAVSAKLGMEDEKAMLPGDIELALDQLIEASAKDPFVLVSTLAQAGHTLPDQAKAVLAMRFALDDRSVARAAAVLCLLDSSAAVRDAASSGLGQAAAMLSPVDLRRLIAMRNWRPEDERAEVDHIIHKVRAAGVACAPWEANALETIQASPLDQSATQVFQLVSQAGRKKRISSILTRNGVVDAFSAEPQTSRDVMRAVRASNEEVLMLDVERSYLDRLVSHHIALCVAGDGVPTPGLLEVAEAIGGADWQPQLIDFHAALDDLTADLPDELHDPDEIEAALADSDLLIGLEDIEATWFEDNAELQQLVQSVSRGAHDQLVTRLLHGGGAIAARREQWAELFIRTALWMREAPDHEEMSWADLAVVARAMLTGVDLTKIGLMRNIAERTVAYMSDQLDDDAE